MFDIPEAIGEPLYYDTERKPDLSLTESTFPLGVTITREALTIGEYEQTTFRSTFTKSDIKQPKPPVYVEDNSIMLSSKELELSKPYYVRLENKTYVVFMPKEGVIDIYALPE